MPRNEVDQAFGFVKIKGKLCTFLKWRSHKSAINFAQKTNALPLSMAVLSVLPVSVERSMLGVQPVSEV